MAGNMSTTYANYVAKWLANQAAPPTVTGLYAALIDTSGNEITTATLPGYARIQITCSTVGTGTSFNNTNMIQFATNNTGAAITVGGVAVYDALTAGNVVQKQTPGSISIANGSAYQIPASDLTIGES